ncbi:MAG: PKD domain-containing protein, partial [Armatimonadetes bacterium]|nr:PKD domain-containing protein [Armatimonadota bacterium]
LARDGKTAWVPVEAAPKMGHAQPILGKVPLISTPTGGQAFDPRYISFTNLVDLPLNLSPVAKIRPPNEDIPVGATVKIFAISSYDPDGIIVLYRWNFGDGESETSTTWFARHAFDETGVYTVTLAVTDNRGKTSTTSLVLRVIDRPKVEEPPSVKGGGCGCGH